MPYQILASHFGTPELVIIAVCLTICFLIIRFWRYIGRWQFFVASFFLSAGLSIFFYGSNYSNSLLFSPVNLFLLNLVSSSSRLAFTIAIPVLIRKIVGRPVGGGASFVVAFLSMIIGNSLVAFMWQGFPVLHDPMTIIFYAVAAYKIMRSVAGFSSVLGGASKESQDAEGAAVMEKPVDKEASVRTDGNIDGEIKFDVKTVAIIIMAIVITLLVIIVAPNLSKT